MCSINNHILIYILDWRPKAVPAETELPRHIIPTNYELYLAPDFYHDEPVDFKSWGHAHITFTGKINLIERVNRNII